MPDEQVLEDKAPYLSLTTLINFLDKWGDGPMPPRIDKSALENYSGGTQALLMSTLRLMHYVDQEGRVMPALRDAVRDTPRRKEYMEAWARLFYAPQLSLAEQNATAQMLHESFATFGYNGSTLRKAVVFYLQLVDYLGLPNSPLFKAPKQSGTATSRRRRPTQPLRSSPDTLAAATPPPAAPRGETTVVSIGDLATITVTVDAHWMKLPVEKITSMREAIAKLEALGTTEETP